MNPFTLLEVPTSADDSQIKTAYLTKIKQFVPEHYPEQFQQLQSAFALIKDEASRVKYRLLEAPDDDLSFIIQHSLISQPESAKSPVQRQRPPASLVLKLLATSEPQTKPQKG